MSAARAHFQKTKRKYTTKHIIAPLPARGPDGCAGAEPPYDCELPSVKTSGIVDKHGPVNEFCSNSIHLLARDSIVCTTNLYEYVALTFRVSVVVHQLQPTLTIQGTSKTDCLSKSRESRLEGRT